MVINIVLIIVLVLVLVTVKNYSSILLISRISLRNLIRHKRRSILLGSAIAFGVMIIFVSNGFAAGITDILFNKVVVNMTGHVGINFYEQGKEQKNIMRDKEKILERIKSSGIEIKEVKESVMIFVRIIGNGKGDNVALSGINISENMDKNSLKNSHKVIQGTLESFINGTVENPLIISQKKAAKLNVKVNDSVNVKLTTIYGQQQTAKMKVVAIEKGDSLFSSMSSYARLDDLKRIMGYKKWESANIQIMIDKPKENARKTADALYNALKPDTAAILSHFAKENRTEEAMLVGYGEKAESIDGLKKEVNLVSGIIEKDGVLLSRGLAEKLLIKQGELFAVSYKKKYEEGYFEKKFVVTAIIDKNGLGNIAFINEKEFYEMYLNNSPADLSEKEAEITSAKWNLAPYLCKEWYIAERANTQSDMEKNRKALRKQKVKMTVAEVSTMYESASMIVMMETALNIITLSAVLILFIIILIGIVNTLRMTIRERTREIGTIRAVGMQKNDVQNLFLFEMGFLTIFSVIAGTLVGVIVEKLLGMIKISTNGSPIEMLFNNGYLNFKTDFSSLIFNIGIIVIMILAASYFPSKKASELKPNEALRHLNKGVVKMKKILMIVTLIMTTMTLYAETDVNKILTVIEEQMALKTDMKAKVKLTQQKVEQGLKILEVSYFRRDSDDSFIMVTTAPESENGNGYLRVGENFWMYKRNTRTFQHINRDESIGGTNAKSGDFEKRKLTELYKPAGEIKEEMLGKTPVYRFDILAKVNDVEYPKKHTG